MKIGYIYNLQAYPPRGGNHAHVVELVQGFISSGYEVSVVDDPSMPGVSNFKGVPAGLERFINDIDLLYVRIDGRFLRQWDVLDKCMRLKGHRPVIWEINAPANETLAFSWLGGKTGSDGGEGFLRRIKRALHALRKQPAIHREESYRRSLAKNVSAAICVSSALGRYAKEGLGIEETVVLPNGGPLISKGEILHRRQKREENQAFTVLYTGSAMYPWQGLNYLSGAIALAEHDAPDIKFVLAVNQRTDTLPASANVEIVEGLDREQILDAICAADACVALHPEYFWSKWKFHGSPMKLFEYMGCMSPVVTSNLGQMREIINDGVDGLLCENEPRDILRKLIFLRDNPDKAENIGKKGWENIQAGLSWRENTEKTLAVMLGSLSD